MTCIKEVADEKGLTIQETIEHLEGSDYIFIKEDEDFEKVYTYDKKNKRFKVFDLVLKEVWGWGTIGYRSTLDCMEQVSIEAEELLITALENNTNEAMLLFEQLKKLAGVK